LLETRRDPFLDAFSVGGTGRELQLGHGRLEELDDLALSIGQPVHALRRFAVTCSASPRRPALFSA
jgi:hypothetical protein